MQKIVFDTECDSLNIFARDIVILCAQIDDGEIKTYIDILPLRDILEDTHILKIGANLKFEKHKLLNYDIHLHPPYFDTQIASWLLGMGRPHVGEDGVKYSYGLKDLAEYHLGVVEPDKFKDLSKRYGHKVGRKLVEARASEIPKEILAAYCHKDVSYTRALWQLLGKQIEAQGLSKRFEKIEMPFIDVLVDMERAGITLNVNYLDAYRAELMQQRDETERKLNELSNL